jgi:exodeoxyribonuclease V alpha subunit
MPPRERHLENVPTETVSGVLKDIRYHADGFLIARLDTGVVVKGGMLWPEIGMQYVFHGRWERHPRFGDGFKFEDYQAKQPTSAAAIQEYLVENADGIGPKIAEKLTEAFGERTLEVLKTEPEKAAAAVAGLTPDRAFLISHQLKKIEEREALCLTLKDMVSGTRIPKSAVHDIIKRWGSAAPDVLRSNPYQLIDEIERVGFVIADAIAKKVGFQPEGYPRIRAGAVYALKQAASQSGHVFLPKALFIQATAELLAIGADKVAAALPTLLQDGNIILREERVYLAALFHDESSVAAKVKILLEKP